MRSFSRLFWSIITCSLIAGCDVAPQFKSADITGAPYGHTLELADHHGKPRRLEDWRGKVVVLFFGFTHCPDVCPTTLTLLGDVRKRMGAQAPQVVLVSVDPQRDTPEAMAQYLQGFDPAIVGLTGSPQAIEAFAAALGVAHRRIPMGDTYMVDHTAAVFAIDPQGRRAAVFTPPLDAGQIAGDLQLLAAHR